MKSLLAATAVVLTFASGAYAELVTKTSPHSVDATADKLIAAVEGAGAKVFARVDHAAGAASVDMELRPTVMVMFGNPKLGTPALQADQAIGLDLPLRVVIFEGEDGTVSLAYHAPAKLAEDHAIPADAQMLKMMTGALDNLTGAAVAE